MSPTGADVDAPTELPQAAPMVARAGPAVVPTNVGRAEAREATMVRPRLSVAEDWTFSRLGKRGRRAIESQLSQTRQAQAVAGNSIEWSYLALVEYLKTHLDPAWARIQTVDISGGTANKARNGKPCTGDLDTQISIEVGPSSQDAACPNEAALQHLVAILQAYFESQGGKVLGDKAPRLINDLPGAAAGGAHLMIPAPVGSRHKPVDLFVAFNANPFRTYRSGHDCWLVNVLFEGETQLRLRRPTAEPEPQSDLLDAPLDQLKNPSSVLSLCSQAAGMSLELGPSLYRHAALGTCRLIDDRSPAQVGKLLRSYEHGHRLGSVELLFGFLARVGLLMGVEPDAAPAKGGAFRFGRDRLTEDQQVLLQVLLANTPKRLLAKQVTRLAETLDSPGPAAGLARTQAAVKALQERLAELPEDDRDDRVETLVFRAHAPSPHEQHCLRTVLTETVFKSLQDRAEGEISDRWKAALAAIAMEPCLLDTVLLRPPTVWPPAPAFSRALFRRSLDPELFPVGSEPTPHDAEVVATLLSVLLISPRSAAQRFGLAANQAGWQGLEGTMDYGIAAATRRRCDAEWIAALGEPTEHYDPHVTQAMVLSHFKEPPHARRTAYEVYLAARAHRLFRDRQSAFRRERGPGLCCAILKALARDAQCPEYGAQVLHCWSRALVTLTQFAKTLDDADTQESALTLRTSLDEAPIFQRTNLNLDSVLVRKYCDGPVEILSADCQSHPRAARGILRAMARTQPELVAQLYRETPSKKAKLRRLCVEGLLGAGEDQGVLTDYVSRDPAHVPPFAAEESDRPLRLYLHDGALKCLEGHLQKAKIQTSPKALEYLIKLVLQTADFGTDYVEDWTPVLSAALRKLREAPWAFATLLAELGSDAIVRHFLTHPKDLKLLPWAAAPGVGANWQPLFTALFDQRGLRYAIDETVSTAMHTACGARDLETLLRLEPWISDIRMGRDADLTRALVQILSDSSIPSVELRTLVKRVLALESPVPLLMSKGAFQFLIQSLDEETDPNLGARLEAIFRLQRANPDQGDELLAHGRASLLPNSVSLALEAEATRRAAIAHALKKDREAAAAPDDAAEKRKRKKKKKKKKATREPPARVAFLPPPQYRDRLILASFDGEPAPADIAALDRDLQLLLQTGARNGDEFEILHLARNQLETCLAQRRKVFAGALLKSVTAENLEDPLRFDKRLIDGLQGLKLTAPALDEIERALTSERFCKGIAGGEDPEALLRWQALVGLTGATEPEGRHLGPVARAIRSWAAVDRLHRAIGGRDKAKADRVRAKLLAEIRHLDWSNHLRKNAQMLLQSLKTLRPEERCQFLECPDFLARTAGHPRWFRHIREVGVATYADGALPAQAVTAILAAVPEAVSEEVLPAVHDRGNLTLSVMSYAAANRPGWRLGLAEAALLSIGLQDLRAVRPKLEIDPESVDLAEFAKQAAGFQAQEKSTRVDGERMRQGLQSGSSRNHTILAAWLEAGHPEFVNWVLQSELPDGTVVEALPADGSIRYRIEVLEFLFSRVLEAEARGVVSEALIQVLISLITAMGCMSEAELERTVRIGAESQTAKTMLPRVLCCTRRLVAKEPNTETSRAHNVLCGLQEVLKRTLQEPVQPGAIATARALDGVVERHYETSNPDADTLVGLSVEGVKHLAPWFTYDVAQIAGHAAQVTRLFGLVPGVLAVALADRWSMEAIQVDGAPAQAIAEYCISLRLLLTRLEENGCASTGDALILQGGLNVYAQLRESHAEAIGGLEELVLHCLLRFQSFERRDRPGVESVFRLIHRYVQQELDHPAASSGLDAMVRGCQRMEASERTAALKAILPRLWAICEVPASRFLLLAQCPQLGALVDALCPKSGKEGDNT